MKKTIFDAIFASVGSTAVFLFGGADKLLYALIAVIVLDYITGVLVAIANKVLSSSVGFKGIAKKMIMLAIVSLGHIIDAHVIGTGTVFRTAVIFVLLGNEGISIIENAAKLGIPVPKGLLEMLAQFKNEDDSPPAA